jgi:broad specificity phosphatase PhoE
MAGTLSGQYTGLTDLPLTERGERNARRLQERLRGLRFASLSAVGYEKKVSWPVIQLWNDTHHVGD